MYTTQSKPCTPQSPQAHAHYPPVAANANINKVEDVMTCGPALCPARARDMVIALCPASARDMVLALCPARARDMVTRPPPGILSCCGPSASPPSAWLVGLAEQHQPVSLDAAPPPSAWLIGLAERHQPVPPDAAPARPFSSGRGSTSPARHHRPAPGSSAQPPAAA